LIPIALVCLGVVLAQGCSKQTSDTKAPPPPPKEMPNKDGSPPPLPKPPPK
jgi:hypothetical protein